MIDFKKILLIVLDEAKNFHSDITQLRIGRDLFYDAVPIQNREEFDDFLKNMDDHQEFLFLCHVFHAEANKGYLKLLNSKIEDDYNIQALLVSSGDSGDVMKNLFDQEKDTRPVYLYSTFRESLKTGKIKPYTKARLNITIKELDVNIKNGIFLSHSSKDAVVVDKFRDLILHGGLEFDLSKIKFTSREDHGIPAGVAIPNDLRNFMMNEMGLFIQFISKNYAGSRVCLNEEGAAWCLIEEIMYIPILIDEFTTEDISWINTLNKAIKITDKESLMNIYQNRKIFFSDRVDITRFSKKIDEFLKSVP